LGFSACERTTASTKPQDKEKPKADAKAETKAPSWQMRRMKPPKPVHAATIRQGEIAAMLMGTATLDAEERVTILAQVKGIATRVYGVEGRYVRQGSLLAQLENPYLQIADEQAATEIEKARIDLKRHQSLVKRGYVSKETEEQLIFQLRQKQNIRKQTQEDLRNLRIPATISGVVTKQTLRRGSWVLPNAEVFMMEDPRSIVASIAIPEKYLPNLKVDLEATLLSEAIGLGNAIKGRILRIAPTIDAKTGTVMVTIGKLAPLEKLRSGMFVSVNLILERRKDVALVPKQAVLYENNKPVVFRLRGKGGACDIQPLDSAKKARRGGERKGQGGVEAKDGGERKGRGGRKRGDWKKRLAEMTPEEREKARAAWKKRRQREGAEKRSAGEPSERKERAEGRGKERRSFAGGTKGGGAWAGKGGKGSKEGRCGVEKVFFLKGIEDERAVEVRGGLSLGDRVVTLGQEDLQRTSTVRVVKLD
jgi:RND family efflux transporter MFP subunit